MNSFRFLICATAAAVAAAAFGVEGFQAHRIGQTTRAGVAATSLSFFGSGKGDEEPAGIEAEEEPKKPAGFFQDVVGMMTNFDAVVDDFVMKRMGAGEQFYGKRKYNPSGNVEGDYNGMGQSDLIRIEVARVQREEMELRRQRRMEAEEAKRGGP
ncbi:unnamed protein product [Pseudo-nitzschia multistriata]|uniref:Uncharacterized protein n=1 Tax=Pseudo-nitzschia multistriata TaxID=183589 RepID=A0A448Z6B9_9STRA|nr:unnamed protein product [Pseudo-nitzschia multistriata]